GLGAQDAPVEDPGALLHVDVPDQGGTGGDEGAGIDSGRVPADGHEAGAVEIVGHESSIGSRAVCFRLSVYAERRRRARDAAWRTDLHDCLYSRTMVKILVTT